MLGWGPKVGSWCRGMCQAGVVVRAVAGLERSILKKGISASVGVHARLGVGSALEQRVSAKLEGP